MIPARIQPAVATMLFPMMLTAAPALALPEDADQPIEIESDRAELDQNSGTVVYTGSVHVVQGTIEVTADELTMLVEDEKIVRITARGSPAHYQQELEADKGLVKADALTIVYHTRDERVDLEGDAYLEQGGNEIAGELIHYDIVAGRVSAKAGDEERVKVIVQPADRSD